MENDELEFLKGITNVEYIDFNYGFNSINEMGDSREYITSGNNDGTGDCHTNCYCNQINILEFKGKKVYCVSEHYFYFNKIYTTFAEVTMIDVCDFHETIMFLAKYKNQVAISSTIRHAISIAVYESTEVGEIKQQLLDRVKEGEKLTAREYIDWHCKLTGCCATGGRKFIAALGLDLHYRGTLYEFIKMTLSDPLNGRFIRRIFHDEIEANPQYFK